MNNSAPGAGPLTIFATNHQSPLLAKVPGFQKAFSAGQTTIAALASGGDGHYTWHWELVKKSPSSAVDPVLSNADHAVLSLSFPSISTTTQYSFKVTVTDGLGAKHSETSEMVVVPIPPGNTPPLLPLVAAAPSFDISEGLPGFLTAKADGGTPPYHYQWKQLDTDPFQLVLTGADTSSAGFTAPGVDANTTLHFEVVVTDDAGGTFQKDLNVLVHDVHAFAPFQQLRLQSMPNTVSVLTGGTIQLAAVATGGDGHYTWEWSQTEGPAASLNGENTAVLTVVAPAVQTSVSLTFKVKVTDGSGQEAESILHIKTLAAKDGTLLSAALIPGLRVDEGTTVNIPAHAEGGSGHYQYKWSEKPPFVSKVVLSNTEKSVVTLVAPAVTVKQIVYLEVLVTDTQTSATVTQPVRVIVNDISASLQLSALNDITVTAGDAVSLHGSSAQGGKGPYTYSWAQSPGTGPAVILEDSDQINARFTAPSVATPTTLSFVMTVTDALGNTARLSERVTVNPVLLAQLTGANTAVAGTDMTLNARVSGGIPPYSYTYTTEGARINIDHTANPTFTVPDLPNATVKVTLLVHDATSPAPHTDSASHSFTIEAPVSVGPPHYCQVCGDIDSGAACTRAELLSSQKTLCPTGKPNCSMDGVFSTSANKVYRRCVSDKQAKEQWWEGTLETDSCMSVLDSDRSIDALVGVDLTCHYICQGDMCNAIGARKAPSSRDRRLWHP